MSLFQCGVESRGCVPASYLKQSLDNRVRILALAPNPIASNL